MACCAPTSRSNVETLKEDDFTLDPLSAAQGLPLLVTPATVLGKDADIEPFDDFLARTLADVRRIVVAEHEQRLQLKHSASAKLASWDLALASQPWTWEQLQPSADAATACISERGTQTQVDWSWPSPPLDLRSAAKKCKSTESLDADEPAAYVTNVATDESYDIIRGESLVLDSDTPFQRVRTGQPRVFGSITSSILRERSEDKLTKFRREEQELTLSTWQRVALRSKKAPLEMVDAGMSFVILANALAIAASCDTKDWEQGWLVVDSMFAIAFTLELFIKIFFTGLLGFFCGGESAWACFETSLVVMSLFEIAMTLSVSDTSALNGSTLFRIVRLIRLVKLLRICRVPMATDLVMMVSGIVGGGRTLISAQFLILFPLMIFALVMRETLGEEPDVGDGAENFNTLPKACFTTFRCLVVEDCADASGRPIFVLVAETYGWMYSAFYSLAVVFLKFGLYNVIVAIFVEQTVEAAKHNEVYHKRARLRNLEMFKEKSLELAELAYSMQKKIPRESCHLTLEEMQDLELSKEEFFALCEHPEFQELLAELDVAEENHLDLFDTLDVDGGGTLDLAEIVSGIGKLRGDARKSDIVAVALLARHLSENVTDFKEETRVELQAQSRQLLSIQNMLKPIFNVNASPRCADDAAPW